MKRPASAASSLSAGATKRRPAQSAHVVPFALGALPIPAHFCNPEDPTRKNCKEMVSKLSAAELNCIQEKINRLGDVVSVVGLCSGANCATVQCGLLTEMLNVGKVHDLATCEVDKDKMAFAEFVVKTVGGQEEHCAFEDVLMFKKGAGSIGGVSNECIVHNKECRFPNGLIATCGYSCVNLSKQFNSKGGVTRDKCLEALYVDRSGQTGQTAGALMDVANKARWPVLFWENSDEKLKESNKDNYADFEVEAYRNGYANHGELYCLADYGVPNGRKRSCGVQYEFQDCGIPYRLAKDLARSTCAMVLRFRTKPQLIADFLFENSSPYVQFVLSQLEAVKGRKMEHEVIETDWPAKFGKMCKKEKILPSEPAGVLTSHVITPK